jgi:glycosyltransferase involved in cell wall biosynthesis
MKVRSKELRDTKRYFQLRNRLLKFKLSKLNKIVSCFFGKPIYQKFSQSASPKVSIVGIFHNQCKEIDYWMDSVQNQSLKDIEIIVVNMSTDKSLRKLKKYKKYDKRIEIINHEKDYGIHRMRKDGALAASAKYTMFLDGDDFLYHYSCKMAYDKICNTKSDFLQYNVNTLVTGKVVDANFQQEKNANENAIDLPIKKYSTKNLWRNIILTQTCKRAFEKSSNDSICIGDDYYEMVLVKIESKLYSQIVDKLVVYFMGEGSFSKTGQDLSIIKRSLDSLDYIKSSYESIGYDYLYGHMYKSLTQTLFTKVKPTYLKMGLGLIHQNLVKNNYLVQFMEFLLQNEAGHQLYNYIIKQDNEFFYLFKKECEKL